MRHVLFLAFLFSLGVVSVSSQDVAVDKAGANLKKLLRTHSKLMSKVSFNGCQADIRILTTEMDFRYHSPSTPPQGMAGFPTDDYGSNFSGDSTLIYRSKSYLIDLSQVDIRTLNTSEISTRGRRFANIAFMGDSVLLKTRKGTENVNHFRLGIEPKAISKVEAAFRDLILACAGSK